MSTVCRRQGARLGQKQKSGLYTDKLDYYRYRLRDIIFGIVDIELRKQIIRMYRQLRERQLEDLQRHLWEAHRQMINAEQPGHRAFILAPAGALLVAIGWICWYWVGAFAIGIGAVIFAIYDTRRIEQTKQYRLREATSNVADAQLALDNAVAHGEIFTGYKEQAGERAEANH